MNTPDQQIASYGRGLGWFARNYRWTICALLFFAAVINYVDRQIIGILKPVLQAELGWNEIDYSNIVFWFQVAYAIGFVSIGRLMDWIGTRKGFTLSVGFWSLAAMAHALAHSVMGFSAARFALGLGEAGNFPAAIKTVAEWFPKKERALATGIFNSGTNIGAIVTPLTVPLIAASFGWRPAFIITGLLGFVWLIFWLLLYSKPEEHPRITKEELAHINSDPPETATLIPWASLLTYRQTWAFAIGKFLTDPIWWFYLFWIPGFLYEKFNLSLTSLGLPLVIIYLAADVGSIGGGWLSSALIKRGWTINAARKTAMLICALCVVPIVFAAQTSNVWVAVALLSLATAAHQGWSANLFTTTSDMFPRRAVGSVVGIGGMAGAIGGMFIAKAAGYILQWTGSYLILFVMAGSAYILALLLIHLLAPHLEEADFESAPI
ncbi:MAG: Hexuronate transporter [uncultured Pyrinomonadaceae bacterium]|uniref:Hexuronate transporter n=1 Tax=uncultured Pyrinomonadaceae bacterium TaxID=2283094 RepID=A0A6J4NFB8_9BACT|nr:MAG: Hexuronate transporter [uncultured Pyrinomonadaceae bacterium]